MCLLLLINKLIASPTEVELRHEFRHHDYESHCFYEYEIYLENHFCHFNRDKSRNRNFEQQRKQFQEVQDIFVSWYWCPQGPWYGYSPFCSGLCLHYSSGSRGRSQGGHASPVPVKIGKEKDCSQGNHINFLFVG